MAGFGSGTPGRSILETIASAATGAAAGLGINEISGSRFGHRAFAAAVAAWAVLLVSNRVRRLPALALLPRVVSWTSLAAAVVALAVASFGPRAGSGYAVVSAAALTTAAVRVVADRGRALELVTGVATIGLGVAAIGWGGALLGDNRSLRGIAGLLFGITLIGGGVSGLGDREYLYGVSVIGGGLAVAGLAVGLSLRQFEYFLWVAPLGGGIALIGMGLAWLGKREYLRGIAFIGIGIGSIGVGVGVLRNREYLRGIALIGMGLGLIGYAIALIGDDLYLLGFAAIGLGVAVIGGGVALLYEDPGLRRTAKGVRARLFGIPFDSDADDTGAR